MLKLPAVTSREISFDDASLHVTVSSNRAAARQRAGGKFMDFAAAQKKQVNAAVAQRTRRRGEVKNTLPSMEQSTYLRGVPIYLYAHILYIVLILSLAGLRGMGNFFVPFGVSLNFSTSLPGCRKLVTRVFWGGSGPPGPSQDM